MIQPSKAGAKSQILVFVPNDSYYILRNWTPKTYVCVFSSFQVQLTFCTKHYQHWKTPIHSTQLGFDIWVQSLSNLNQLPFILTISAPHQIRNLSLPVQRDLCVVKTTYAELLIDMFTTYADEQRHQQLQEARKGSVEKVMSLWNSNSKIVQGLLTIYYTPVHYLLAVT